MTLDGPDPSALVEAYAATLPYTMDRFQEQACIEMLTGDGVLVCAPTGSGKTVIGEFGAWLAVETSTRTFYTTPMKALSNQKFRDLSERYGAEQVGLLTGDNQIRGHAPIVVMTTEVLRNMLYEGSDALRGLGVVVLDEVHYLGDRERGATWEEVIIHLDPRVRIAALSATVSNHERFAAWLRALRGDVALVLETSRPVPIQHQIMAGGALFPLLDEAGRGPSREARRANEAPPRARQESRGRGGRRGRPARQRVDRPKVIERLKSDEMLPAICFVFSRAGCQAAVEEVLARGIKLTSSQERERIDEIVARNLEPLSPNDREALGAARWQTALRAGVAAHHAGLIPLFKETVEELFTQALLKVVYATETLALGINMPARTVVIERVTKYTGEGHALLTVGEYTQLTGRAGRRGIDPIGYGVVLSQPDVDVGMLAELASGSSFPLRSAFRPSYNMAVNLLARMDRAAATETIGRSFAQFLADEDIGAAEARLARQERFLASYREHLVCECGDVWGWWTEKRKRESSEAEQRRRRRTDRQRRVDQVLAHAKPGDVLAVSGDRFVVTDRRRTKRGEFRCYGIYEHGEQGRLSSMILQEPPTPIGALDLPRKGPRDPGFLESLREVLASMPLPRDATPSLDGSPSEGPEDPVQLCEHRRAHEHWCRQVELLEGEVEKLRRQVRRRTGALARAFDAVVGILKRYGYVDDQDELTPAGRYLARIYSGSDLLVMEALRRGILQRLDAPSLAAVMSSVLYETRPGQGPPESPPTEDVHDAIRSLKKLSLEIAEVEEEARVELTGGIDHGLSAATYWWARGEDLQTSILDERLQPGDFVRWMKQVDDLLRQLATSEADPQVARVADEASKLLRRGVVDLELER
ncbi:MAG: DEAD/DEAH box helicase [Actinomycetota bacterium]